MPRPNKEKIISDLVLELEKGAERKDIVSKYCKKLQRSERTVDSYWKIAQKRYSEIQERRQKELEAEKTEAEKERLKKAILTKDERLEIATKIAKGEGRKTPIKFDANGRPIAFDIIYPTDGDRLRAIDYMSKIEGEFAPKKLDHTTGGESINPMSNIQVVIKER